MKQTSLVSLLTPTQDSHNSSHSLKNSLCMFYEIENKEEEKKEKWATRILKNCGMKRQYLYWFDFERKVIDFLIFEMNKQ